MPIGMLDELFVPLVGGVERLEERDRVGDVDDDRQIELEPFRRLATPDRIVLEELADRLARFVEPLEPSVYARYRRWRKDDA